MYWDHPTKVWRDLGCIPALGTDGASTLCACNHTTNFAVLFDTSGTIQNLTGTSLAVLNAISYLFCGVSALCCLLTFIVLQISK